MKLHIVDILIICAYLMVIVAIGLFLKKKAAKNMDSYFLGGKSLPFYMLGLSNASGMFDITGTMLMVYWAFAYGFKSLWIPWLWPVFNQIFLMVYLSVWLLNPEKPDVPLNKNDAFQKVQKRRVQENGERGPIQHDQSPPFFFHLNPL